MKKLAIILAALAACQTPVAELPEPTVVQKQTAAGATYKAKLLACVADNDTNDSIDACADAVRNAWHRDGGAK